MAFLKNHAKKLVVLSFAVSSVVILSVPSFRAEAQDSEKYLKIIADNTTAILDRVNTLPKYIEESTAFMLAWTKPDETDTTANIQKNFTELSNEITKNKTTQQSLQQRLTQDYFGSYVTQATMPYANDLTFQTMLGKPFFAKDPRQERNKNIDPVYNYTKNAAGINVSHVVPGSGSYSWQEGPNLINYVNYYNTVSAVQTFNAYVVSQLYADAKNGSKQTEIQKTLTEQASSGDWFAQVSAEKIGIVLRQILMFDSQSYLYLSRLFELQQQMVIAQSMTNTLLISLNQQNEETLLKKATGTMPGQQTMPCQ